MELYIFDKTYTVNETWYYFRRFYAKAELEKPARKPKECSIPVFWNEAD